MGLEASTVFTSTEFYCPAAIELGFKKRGHRTFGQDGGVNKYGAPPCTTIAKITIILQNNYPPESSENQAVCKSDNQGIKEVTFIQITRRG